MDDNGDILFSPFLAGIFLIKKSVTYIELSNYICEFEEKTNKSILDDNLFKLDKFVIKTGDGFALRYELDDYIDGCTVERHLYDMTTEEIRSFFGYSDQKFAKYVEVGKSGGFKKIRTRFFSLI